MLHIKLRMLHINATPLLLLTALPTLLAVCTGEAPQSAGERRELLAFLSGNAVGAVGPDGLLRVNPAGRRPFEITEAEAGSLATDWVESRAKYVRTTLETQHEGPIDVEGLRVCRRTFYAASAFESLAAEVTPPWQRIFGPWWVVTFCGSHGTPQVLITVSALNTDLLIQAADRHPIEGSRFRWFGVPEGRLERLLVTPEEAVEQVARFARKRITRVPTLIVPHGIIHAARWRLDTDGAAVVRGRRSGRAVTTSTLYMGRPRDPAAGRGPEPVIAVADPAQPRTVEFTYYTIVGAPPPQVATGAARLKEGETVRIEQAEKSRPQGN